MSVTIIDKQPPPIPVGMGEMPWQGRRWMRVKYRYSDGSMREELREVPETGRPYFWIPSFGAVSREEMEYLAIAQAEKEGNPASWRLELREKTRERKRTLNQRWRDLCDARAAEQKGERQFAMKVTK